MIGIRFSRFTMLLFLSMIISSFAWPNVTYAAGEPVCAEVKIEIKQELTLERQGFDARMKINNDLDGVLYFVGAELSYTMDGELKEVIPSSYLKRIMI